VFERYTERARRTIFHAKYEALSRGAREIEPKDIGLGLTRDAHQSGCPFAMLHENAAQLRALIGSEPSIYGPPEHREIRLSSTSKKVLADADVEGKWDRCYSIGSDHLLRGVLRAGDETAAKMTGAGYTLSAMRKASCEAHRLCEAQRSNPGMAAPLRWRLGRYRRRLLVSVSLIILITIILYLRSQN
jgi:ATP-dependent Clp protease ATP-binding subunit ClpC